MDGSLHTPRRVEYTWGLAKEGSVDSSAPKEVSCAGPLLVEEVAEFLHRS